MGSHRAVTGSLPMFLTSLLFVVAGSPAPPIETVDPYVGALDRSIDRCQQRIRERLTLWSDHSDWSDPWRVQTRYFLVQTASRYWVGRDVGLGLDAMIPRFQSLLGTSYEPAAKIPVLLFPTLSLYNAFGSDAGTHSSILGSFFADGQPNQPVAVLMDDNLTQVKMWATHSALHKYLAMAFNAQPDTWLVEGLASYFTCLWDPAWARGELRRILDSGRYVPAQNLVRENIDSYSADPHTRFIELGMLFTYLLHHREDTRMNVEDEEREPPSTSFQDFLQLAVRGQNVDSHPFAREFFQRGGEIEADFRALDWLQP